MTGQLQEIKTLAEISGILSADLLGTKFCRLWRDGGDTAATANADIESHNFGNHSPTGINWGYGGSGPAALAADLLLAAGFNRRQTSELYQSLKNDLVAKLPVSVASDRIALATVVVVSESAAIIVSQWRVAEAQIPPGAHDHVRGGSIYVDLDAIQKWAHRAPEPPGVALLVVYAADEAEAKMFAAEGEGVFGESDAPEMVRMFREIAADKDSLWAVGAFNSDATVGGRSAPWTREMQDAEVRKWRPLKIETSCAGCGKEDKWRGAMKFTDGREDQVERTCACGHTDKITLRRAE